MADAPPAAPAEPADGSAVAELASVLAEAKLPPNIVASLTQDVVATGAVHVRELTPGDWEGLPSWSCLKPLERRRVLTRVPP